MLKIYQQITGFTPNNIKCQIGIYPLIIKPGE
jgi:hypothetical protein